MPDPNVLSVAPVVVLGVTAAIAWGAGDFGGGLAARRAPILGVALFVQAIGMVLAVALWAVRAEPLPGPADATWAALAGLLGAFGIAGLYQSLALGRMSIVAPVTGVIGAALPVVAGIALEGPPPTLALAGIGLAIVAVVLVSLTIDRGPAAGPSGLPYALAAGIGIGGFAVAISRVADGLVFGPLVVVRVVETVTFVVVISLSRRPWQLPRPTRGLVVAVAVLDMLGNAAFIAATQNGALAIASVLGSLYPVTTVVLAAAVLRERIGGVHAIGILTAIAAIALIAAGSA
jgi:drug/metabolite transporter (DMT)-like permease